MARLDYAALNSTVRYTMWSVFRVEPGRLGDDRVAAATQAAEFVEALEGKDVVVRGIYDLAGMRADADYMIWWHAEEIEALQAAYADWRRSTAVGRASVPVWSQVALHRPAEFNKSHIPAFLAGEEAAPLRVRLPVRPLLRLVPAARRGAPHHARRPRQGGPRLPGRARQHRRLRSRSATTSGSSRSRPTSCTASSTSCAHLRATEARRHVREEVPFFTGPRVQVGDLVATLP